MLYLFLVDSGTMVQLEIDVALDTVANLKGVIGRACRIPPDKQVSDGLILLEILMLTSILLSCLEFD